MFIKRTDYDKMRDMLLRAEIRLEVVEKHLLAASELRDVYKEKMVLLLARVEKLENALLAANDKLVAAAASKVQSAMTPVRLESILEEDEDLVSRDREFIRGGGSSDLLLAEEFGED